MPKPITVRELPDLRHRLDRHMSQYLATKLESLLRLPQDTGPAVYVPRHLRTLPVDKIAQELAEAELRRIRLGELYYVTPEMTQVALQAGAAMEYYDIRPEDLPSKHGMLVWGEPIGTDSFGEVPVNMLTWGPCEAVDGGPGFWVSYYSDIDGAPLLLEALMPELEQAATSRRQLEEMKETARRMHSFRWAYEREQVTPFGRAEWMADADGRPVNEEAASALAAMPADAAEGTIKCEGYLRTLSAAFLLMGQKVTVTREEQPERAVRRRLARTATPASPVRVTALRRQTQPPGEPTAEQAEDGEGRNYSCQWWVSGHTRNQWYPREERHKPIWIAEHLATPKGAEGAPIKGGERVRVLRR